MKNPKKTRFTNKSLGSGTIMIFYKANGYGFITPDGGGYGVFCHCKMCPNLEGVVTGDAVTYDHCWQWTDPDGRVHINFAYNLKLVVKEPIEDPGASLKRGDQDWERPNKPGSSGDAGWQKPNKAGSSGDAGWQKPNKDRIC